MTRHVFAKFGSIDFLAPSADLIAIIKSPIGCVLFNDPPDWLLDIGSVTLKAVEEYKSLQKVNRSNWVEKKIMLLGWLGDNKLSRALARTMLEHCEEELKAHYQWEWPALLEWRTRWDESWAYVNKHFETRTDAVMCVLRAFNRLQEIMHSVPAVFSSAIEEEIIINIPKLSLEFIPRLGHFHVAGGVSTFITPGYDWTAGRMLYISLALWSCDLSHLNRAAADFKELCGIVNQLRNSSFGNMEIFVVEAYLNNMHRFPDEIVAEFSLVVTAWVGELLKRIGPDPMRAARYSHLLAAACNLHPSAARLYNPGIFHEGIYRQLLTGANREIAYFRQIKRFLDIPDSPELMKEICVAYALKDKDGLQTALANAPQPDTEFIRIVRSLL